MRYIDTPTTERIGYDFYCDIAQRMVEGRARKGWTQEQLAEKAGMSFSRIAAMETVKIRFRLPDVEKIAQTLDVSIDWLLQAEIDDQAGECLYLVWNERFPNQRFYQRATSRRMVFLKKYEDVQKLVIWFEPRDRAIVKLVGVPVTKQGLEAEFPKRGKQADDPVEPN